MSKIDKEEKLANPDMGDLISPTGMEREEAITLLVNCAICAVEANPDVGRRFTQSDRDKIKASLYTASLDELYRRIAALQNQNPGIVVAALERSGIKVAIGKDGSVTMTPDSGDGGRFGGVGATIDYDQFEKTL